MPNSSALSCDWSYAVCVDYGSLGSAHRRKVSIFWPKKMQNQSSQIFRLGTLLLDGALLLTLFVVIGL